MERVYQHWARVATITLLPLIFARTSVVVAGTAPAQAPVGRQFQIQSVKRLKCVFTTGAAATWASGQPQVRRVKGADLLTLEISDIDLSDASATVRRDSKGASASVRSDRSNLYLFVVGTDGTAMITTVFSQETPSGRLKAVHSEGGVSARQFYGDCAVLE